VPSRSDAEKLETVMRRFDASASTEPASEGSFPNFEPHVTLASLPLDTPVSAIRACIPQDQKQINIAFRSLEIGSHYFRSVYLAVNLSPELSALHQEVHAALRIDPKTPAFPHVSLCYVTDKDAEKGLRRQFAESLRVKEESDGISLGVDDEGDESEDGMAGFRADEIWVVRCEGPVETWEVLDIIKLQGDN